MYTRSSFDKEIKNAVDHFIKLAREKSIDNVISNKEFRFLINNLLDLQNSVIDKYHQATESDDDTLIKYLENFARKLENLVVVTKNIDDYVDIKPSIEEVLNAANPPRKFKDKIKHVGALMYGFVGAIVGLVVGAVMGGAIGAGIAAGIAYFVAPPLILKIAIIAGGVTAAIGGIIGAIKGAKSFYHKAENRFKPPSQIHESATTTLKSDQFCRLFARSGYKKINLNEDIENNYSLAHVKTVKAKH